MAVRKDFGFRISDFGLSHHELLQRRTPAPGRAECTPYPQRVWATRPESPGYSRLSLRDKGTQSIAQVLAAYLWPCLLWPVRLAPLNPQPSTLNWAPRGDRPPGPRMHEPHLDEAADAALPLDRCARHFTNLASLGASEHPNNGMDQDSLACGQPRPPAQVIYSVCLRISDFRVRTSRQGRPPFLRFYSSSFHLGPILREGVGQKRSNRYLVRTRELFTAFPGAGGGMS